MVKDGKIYINRGSREGVYSGQTFVVGKTETLRDPDTGEVLDVSMEKAGTIVIDKCERKDLYRKGHSGGNEDTERHDRHASG